MNPLGTISTRWVVAVAIWALTGAGVPGAASDEVVLLGPLTREEIESALPDWVAAELEATPDIVASEELASALAGAKITVFLGTWCSDSRRLLSRLWRAFDEVGILDPVAVRYIGIDRSKREPSEWIGEESILLVPTIVVEKEGRELGRIVETAPHGIETDLAAILGGRQSGVVTGSEEELLEAQRSVGE